jgi:ADP-ribosylglycohydrolase
MTAAPTPAAETSLTTGLGPLPADYPVRVYAGVLGKVIGVYLGRPIENWTYAQIAERLGDVEDYLHDRLNVKLVVPDDDITGTFTFVRALEDNGDDPRISSARIGASWLDYLIEGRTILWWGGNGNSTEHTAYLRLRAGIEAPASGSIELNGQVVAEQIGAQIFIDGWAMLHPGDPGAAADLAQRAARVSHDGVAVHAAQAWAAMEAEAFSTSDIDGLLDVGMSVIPPSSLIRRLVDDVRGWHAGQPDWRATRQRIEDVYGYDTYGGNCHVVPNHALMVLSLLYGNGDFDRTLSIVNTAGWDTDCNSGNVGCLMGIRGGLDGIDAGRDWRGPVGDRLFLPSADPGRVVSDAAREADSIVGMARRMRGIPDDRPKAGARFHFEYPGSVQGFALDGEPGPGARVENVAGHSRTGARSLAIHASQLRRERPLLLMTATGLPSDLTGMGNYRLVASPTLYPGQTVRIGCEVGGDGAGPVELTLVLRRGSDGTLVRGTAATLDPGQAHDLQWRIPDVGGGPIIEVGLEVRPAGGAPAGTPASIFVDYVTWDGAPETVLGPRAGGDASWRSGWVDAVDHWPTRYPDPYRIMQNRGTGLLLQGTEDWVDYAVATDIRIHMATSGGITVRSRGLTTWLGLVFDRSGTARLIESHGERRVIAERALGLDMTTTHRVSLACEGHRLRADVDGRTIFDVAEPAIPLRGGGVGLLCEEGRVEFGPVEITPSPASDGATPD